MRVESPTAVTSEATTFVAGHSGQTEAQMPIPASLKAIWIISVLTPSLQDPDARTRFRSIIDCCSSSKDLTSMLVRDMGARTALELKEVASKAGEGSHFRVVLAGTPELVVRRVIKWGRRGVEELKTRVAQEEEARRVRAAQEEKVRRAWEKEEKRLSRQSRLELHKASQVAWARRTEEAGKPVGKNSYRERMLASGQRRKLKRRKGLRVY